MEVVSAIASVTGIIGFAGQAISGLVKLRTLFKDCAGASKSLTRWLSDLNLLLQTLEDVKSLIEKLDGLPGTRPDGLLESLQIEIEDCSEDVHVWVSKAGRAHPDFSTGTKRSFKKLVEAINKEDKVEAYRMLGKHQEHIATKLSLIGRSLDVEQTLMLKDLTDKVDEVNITTKTTNKVTLAALEGLQASLRTDLSAHDSTHMSLASLADSLSRIESILGSRVGSARNSGSLLGSFDSRRSSIKQTARAMSRGKHKDLDMTDALETVRRLSASSMSETSSESLDDGHPHMQPLKPARKRKSPTRLKMPTSRMIAATQGSTQAIRSFLCHEADFVASDEEHLPVTQSTKTPVTWAGRPWVIRPTQASFLEVVKAKMLTVLPFRGKPFNEHTHGSVVVPSSKLGALISESMESEVSFAPSLRECSTTSSALSCHITGARTTRRQFAVNVSVQVDSQTLDPTSRKQLILASTRSWFRLRSYTRINAAVLLMRHFVTGHAEDTTTVLLTHRQRQKERRTHKHSIKHYLDLVYEKGARQCEQVMLDQIPWCLTWDSSAKTDGASKRRIPLNKLDEEIEEARQKCWQQGYNLDEIDRVLSECLPHLASLVKIAPPTSTKDDTDEDHEPSMGRDWNTKQDRINLWLLQNLQSSNIDADVHKRILANKGQRGLDQEEWTRAVLKHWFLDEAAVGRSGVASTNGAVNSEGLAHDVKVELGLDGEDEGDEDEDEEKAHDRRRLRQERKVGSD